MTALARRWAGVKCTDITDSSLFTSLCVCTKRSVSRLYLKPSSSRIILETTKSGIHFATLYTRGVHSGVMGWLLVCKYRVLSAITSMKRVRTSYSPIQLLMAALVGHSNVQPAKQNVILGLVFRFRVGFDVQGLASSSPQPPALIDHLTCHHIIIAHTRQP